MQGQVGIDIERSADLDFRGGTCRRVRKAEKRKDSGNANGLLGPIHKLRLGNFVFDGERIVCGVGVGSIDLGDLTAEAVGERQELGDFVPFVFRSLMESDAKQEFVIAAHGVANFGGEVAGGFQRGVDRHFLKRGEWKGGVDFVWKKLVGSAASTRRQYQCGLAAKIRRDYSKGSDLETGIQP